MHLFFHDLATCIFFACLLGVASSHARQLVRLCPVAPRHPRRR